jgi:AcrR family transcriptional regulator
MKPRTGWKRPPTQAEKVLDAALEAFVLRGYSATTLEEITTRSGVSVGSVYHHFGSKEGIAGALYSESLQRYQRGLLDALHADPGAEGGVREVVRHHLRWVDANGARARFLLRRRETEVLEAAQLEVDVLNRKLFGALERWRRPLAAAGEIRDLELPLLHAVWLGPAQEYTRLWLQAPERPKELFNAEPVFPERASLLDAAPVLADAAWAAVRTSR